MDSECSLYHELLTALVGREELYRRELVATNAKRGASSEGELLVIRRALNGWDGEFLISKLRDAPGRSKVVEDILRTWPFESRCPLEWVAKYWGRTDGEYNSRRSAFWRVALETSRGLDFKWADAEDWPSHLMWSNLYKVSPADGPNPGNRLCSAQLPACRKILDFELGTLKPDRVLMLTGYDWAYDFLADSSFVKSHARNGKVEWSGLWTSRKSARQIPVVVCPHPQGKSEGPIVSDAVKAFRRLEGDRDAAWRG